jgi:NAD(P) transhydrogenase subunit alpha
VTPALHTPLMSLTNAISSVIVVGALLSVAVETWEAAGSGPVLAKLLGFAALIMAGVNIFGGFLVTQRMLGMYPRKLKAELRANLAVSGDPAGVVICRSGYQART